MKEKWKRRNINMQIKTNHIEPRMEQAYFDMAWHNLDKSGTSFVIVLIVVHRPEIMDFSVFKYGMWFSLSMYNQRVKYLFTSCSAFIVASRLWQSNGMTLTTLDEACTSARGFVWATSTARFDISSFWTSSSTTTGNGWTHSISDDLNVGWVECAAGMSKISAPVGKTTVRGDGIVDRGLSWIVMIVATAWCKYVGGARNSTVAIAGSMGPILSKGAMCLSSKAVGDIRGDKVVDYSGSTRSGLGKEAYELQDIIIDTYMQNSSYMFKAKDSTLLNKNATHLASPPHKGVLYYPKPYP